MQRKRIIFVFLLSIIILSSGCVSSPNNSGASSASSSTNGENPSYASSTTNSTAWGNTNTTPTPTPNSIHENANDSSGPQEVTIVVLGPKPNVKPEDSMFLVEGSTRSYGMALAPLQSGALVFLWLLDPNGPANRSATFRLIDAKTERMLTAKNITLFRNGDSKGVFIKITVPQHGYYIIEATVGNLTLSTKISIPPTSIIDSINAFALDLYRKLAKGDENVFFSPFSIETALAMVYEGARGKTAEEMANVLYLPEDREERLNSFSFLMHSLNLNDTPYVLSTANALWVQKGYPIKKDYVETIETYYLGELHALDFVGNPRGAEDEINCWAEEETKGRIKKLVKGLSSDTRLVLTNAIYLKANWSSRFNPSETHNGTFFFLGGSVVVPFMEQVGLFNYAEGDSFQALEMPYEGERLSMVILLPKKMDGLGELEANLTPQFLDGVIRSLKPEKVAVMIPKFRFEASYKLRDVLIDMGMKSAFTSADFSGISDEPLVVSQAVHKAFISVAENGTEAAAATAVTITLAAPPESEKPKVFNADHPFIFLIYDRETGAVLFMGRMMNPKDG